MRSNLVEMSIEGYKDDVRNVRTLTSYYTKEYNGPYLPYWEYYYKLFWRETKYAFLECCRRELSGHIRYNLWGCSYEK